MELKFESKKVCHLRCAFKSADIASSKFDPYIVHYPAFNCAELKAVELTQKKSIEAVPKLGLIIQARMGSIRLPGKVAKIAGSREYLVHLLERVLVKVPNHQVVVATTKNSEDDLICELSRRCGVKFFRGDSEDVLKRYIGCAVENQFSDVVRLTGDNPLIDPYLIDKMISVYIESKEKSKYLSNTLIPTFPVGFNVEITSLENLKNSWDLCACKYNREHVTPFIKFGGLSNCSLINCSFDKNFNYLRFSLDTTDDHAQLAEIVGKINKFDIMSVVDFSVKNKLVCKNLD